MLLNLSNHPSQVWPEGQMIAALNQYESVEDLPFPQINPEWTSDQVLQLAEEFENIIREINPTAVHIMGELTFTFSLVDKLKRIGFHCIASTTKRNVTEKQGIKQSLFEFVRFRDY